jgi:hypothetical protein
MAGCCSEMSLISCMSESRSQACILLRDVSDQFLPLIHHLERVDSRARHAPSSESKDFPNAEASHNAGVRSFPIHEASGGTPASPANVEQDRPLIRFCDLPRTNPRPAISKEFAPLLYMEYPWPQRP